MVRVQIFTHFSPAAGGSSPQAHHTMSRALLLGAAVGLASSASDSPPLPSSLNCSVVQHGVCLHNAYPILRSFSCVDAAQCCANCTADPKCISWNINSAMKSCFLRGSYKTNPGAACISGCVRGTCQPPPPPPPPPPAPPPPPPTFTGVTCTNTSFAGRPYCNQSLSIAARVASIVSLMTTAEKILMLDNNNPGVARLGIRPMQFGEGLHGVASSCGKPGTHCSVHSLRSLALQSLVRMIASRRARAGRPLRAANGLPHLLPRGDRGGCHFQQVPLGAGGCHHRARGARSAQPTGVLG